MLPQPRSTFKPVCVKSWTNIFTASCKQLSHQAASIKAEITSQQTPAWSQSPAVSDFSNFYSGHVCGTTWRLVHLRSPARGALPCGERQGEPSPSGLAGTAHSSGTDMDSSRQTSNTNTFIHTVVSTRCVARALLKHTFYWRRQPVQETMGHIPEQQKHVQSHW